MDRLEKLQKCRSSELWDEVLTVASLPMHHNATLNDSLVVPEPAAASVLLAYVKSAEDLDFDETNVVPLFKKKN